MTYDVERYLHGNRLTSYPDIGTNSDMLALSAFFCEVCPFEVQYNPWRYHWLFTHNLRMWCVANCTGYWTDSIILKDNSSMTNSRWRFQHEADAALFKLQLP